jgi:DNA-binding response OmpR family regulator
MKILVVEDYEPLRRSLVRGLREAGYAVDSGIDGEEALGCAESTTYDVIILDLMLPKVDGLAVLERLRAREVASRILVLTARGEVDDRVRALDMGADDYLVKPFAFEELLARVRALQRRRYRQTSPVIKIGDLEVDTSARIVRLVGRPVELTAREYSILEVLACRRGQIVTRDEIWERIYDFAAERNSNVVDVYIGYLRKKLSRDGCAPLIRTKRGLGYVLEDES